MLGGAAAWSAGARPQQLSKLPRIGFLQRIQNENVVAFIQALREAGYVDGQNAVLETRIFETTLDRLPDLAKELVDLKCDVILAASQYAFVAAMKATTTIPIVRYGLMMRRHARVAGWSERGRGLGNPRWRLRGGIKRGLRLGNTWGPPDVPEV
jgi:hypothetical protein